MPGTVLGTGVEEREMTKAWGPVAAEADGSQIVQMGPRKPG